MLIVVAIALASVNPFEPQTDFLKALAWQESSWNPKAFNKSENAVGIYQIRPIYLEDVQRIDRSFLKFKHKDMYFPVYADMVVNRYLIYYGKHYKKVTGKEPTTEIFARIHNGGPYGWRKDSTIKYWNKIKKHMEEKPWEKDN